MKQKKPAAFPKKNSIKIPLETSRLLEAANSFPFLIWFADSRRRCRFFTSNQNQWFGQSTEKTNGRHLREIIGASNYQKILPEIETVLAGREISFDRFLDHHGKPLFVEASFIPQRLPDGSVNGFFALLSNMTERGKTTPSRRSRTAAITAARAEERRTISRLLHDEIVQQMAVSSIILQRMEKTLVKLLPAENHLLCELVKVQEILLDSQRALRRIGRSLRSESTENVGLVVLLREFIDELEPLLSDRALLLTLEIPDDLPALEPSLETNLYRIAREAVTNAVKHSAARRLSVGVFEKAAALELVIRDDGHGFNPKTKNNGIGIASMRERTALLNAKLKITSGIEAGTEITLTLPLKNNRRL